jgi:hypothetical protein
LPNGETAVADQKSKWCISLYQAGFLFLSLITSACDSGCANERLETVKSPDGDLQAVLFRRDCGTTTDYSTQVSIISANAQLPDKSANVFIADTNHGESSTHRGGGPIVKAKWLDNKNLQISYDSRLSLFMKRDNLESKATMKSNRNE